MNFITAYDIGVNKPNIPQKVYSNWQEIVDSLTSIADVPSALIMHVLPDSIEVACTSHTQAQNNPYNVEASEHLGCGLYCETVMKEKSELYVKNALKDENWKDNPDLAIDMIGYYGQPLLWPDNTVYGTICILDKKDLIPSTTVKELLGLFRKSIENDLEIIELSHLQEKQNIQLADLNKNLEQQIKEEVEDNRKKDQQLIQQSQLAQMGEMISMIAHQWRQPLNIISLNTVKLETSILFNNEMSNEEIYNITSEINKQSQYLSNTIDDFRYFYRPNKESVTVKLKDVISKSLSIIKASLISSNIEIIEEYKSKEEIELYDNEMMQVILNILINAQDNFQEKDIKNPYIKITTENRTISICDNGGGIPENIIDKIFDPYFSTKDEKNGAGLGLYLSKTIIKNNHNGKLRVRNIDDGVCFTIELEEISKK